MNESNMGEGGKSWREKIGGAVKSFASFGREVLSGQSVDNFVDENTQEGQRFIRTTDDIAQKWGVSGDLMREAADTLADITSSQSKKDAALTKILDQAGIKPGDPNYNLERQNLEINMSGAVQTARARRSTIGQMFSSDFDGDR